ncbi:MAG: hypothetical protein ABJC12_04335 [Saprospiraceae bacterium]
MKNSIIISIVTILPYVAFSQYYGEIQLGVEVSKMRIPKEIEVINNPVVNPELQGSIIRIISPKFSGVISAQFTYFGFAANETQKSPATKLCLSYALAIPKVEYLISSSFSATAGISFGKLLSTSRKSDPEGWKKVNEYNYFEDFEFGLIGGIQYHFGDFIIGTNYFYSISNIANFGDGWTDLNHVVIEEPKAHNRSFSVGLSYRFKL